MKNRGLGNGFQRCYKHENSESLEHAAKCRYGLLQPSPLSMHCIFRFEAVYVYCPVDAPRSPARLSQQPGIIISIHFGIPITPIIPNITLKKLPLPEPKRVEMSASDDANNMLPKPES